MKLNLIVTVVATVATLMACGKNNDNNRIPPAVNNGQSTRQWQNVSAMAACNEATDAAHMCNNGQTIAMFNWDGSFNFNNGQRSGNISADDLNRLVAATDPVMSQDTVQQQACANSNTNILFAHSISVAPTANPSAPVVVYEERSATDQVCARGDINRLRNLRDLLAQLAAKYSAM